MPGTGGEDLDLIALARLVWEQRLLVAICVVLGGAIAATWALLETPMYRAEVVVTDARDQTMGSTRGITSQLGGLASLAGVNLNGADSASREAHAILGSRNLAEEFIKRYKLIDAVAPNSGKPTTLWLAVKKFRSNVLDIREDPRKGITTIDVDLPDPVQAAHWANDFVALANEVVRTRALNNATRNIAYLNEQLAKTQVVEVQKLMYNIIESETKTLMLANSRAEYAFTVVDPAVAPEMKVSPQRTLMVAVGLFLGFVVGATAAFFRNLIRRNRHDIR
jgi:uncharacterized protein involved in exopolysaccharide biosynthesis